MLRKPQAPPPMHQYPVSAFPDRPALQPVERGTLVPTVDEDEDKLDSQVVVARYEALADFSAFLRELNKTYTWREIEAGIRGECTRQTLWRCATKDRTVLLTTALVVVEAFIK